VCAEHNRERYVTHYVGENEIHTATRRLHDEKCNRHWKKDRARNKLRKKLRKRSKRKLRELRR